MVTEFAFYMWTNPFNNHVCVDEQAKEISGITIFRSSATIYYANAELYQEALLEKVHKHTRRI